MRVAMSLRRNLVLALTCDKTAGEVGKQIAGASFAAIAARNKRLLAAFFKDKAQIAEAAKPNFNSKNTLFL